MSGSFFSIYANNYLKFKLETGSGSLNNGLSPRNNKLFEEESQNHEIHNYYAQPIVLGESVRVQFQSDSLDNFYLYVCDEDRLVKEIIPGLSLINFDVVKFNALLQINVEGRLYISRQAGLAIDDELTSWEAYTEPLEAMRDIVPVNYYHRKDLEDGLYFDGALNSLTHYGYFPSLRLTNFEIEEEEDSTQDSKGELYLVSSKAAHNYTLRTDLMPAYMHDKLQRILRHSTVIIDGERYVKNGDYEIETTEKTALMQASCRVRKVDTYSEINY